MGHVNIERYITTPKTAERVQRLNTAVNDCELLIVTGPSGSGKRAFLEWWWGGGCEDTAFAGKHAINSDDILLINALHPGTASASSIILTNLKVELLEAQRTREKGEKRKALQKPKNLYSDGALASLFFETIRPLMDDEIQPSAIAILNADQLDVSALTFLLELYAPTRKHTQRHAEIGLILCGNTKLPDKLDSPLRKILKAKGLTRVALDQALEFEPLADAQEYAAIIATLIQQNLQAKLGDDLTLVEILAKTNEWAEQDWFRIRQMATIADRCLGSKKDGEPRLFTRKVLDCIEKKWINRKKTD